MHYYQLPTGRIGENTYFIVQKNLNTLVVDPGEESDVLLNFVTEHNLKPVGIVLTHAHWDHIQSVDRFRDVYNIPVYVHVLEKEFLENPTLNLSARHPFNVVAKAPDKLLEKMGNITIEGFDCRIEHVPGHSPGSVVYLFEKEGFAVVGDTLFKGGCGRTDLPGSSTHFELMSGIQAHLMTLPDDTVVLSGHGEKTTIGIERRTNPYLNGVTR